VVEPQAMEKKLHT